MRKITLEEFERRVQIRFPTEQFKIINYTSMAYPMDIQCESCGQVIHVSKASNFLIHSKAYGCKNCNGLWRQREQNLAALQERYDIINTSVKDTHTYYTIKCKNCGHIRTSTLKNLMHHLDCGCITNVKRSRTPEEFLQEVNEHSDLGKYELVSEYKNQITPVLLRHECGFIWKVRPGDIIHGRSQCPRCRKKQSKGEIMIGNILTDLDIQYEQEKRLNNSRQRFDFYFELKNVKYAIEYNGIQHYEETSFFRASLAEQQKRDATKKMYCEENNIQLIIIPYWLSDEDAREIIISSTTIS